MRWAALFSDLESRADALAVADRAVEVSDRTRIEAASTMLTDRLRAGIGSPVRLRCDAGLTLLGSLSQVGSDWVLIDEGEGREAVVGIDAIISVSGLTRFADEAPSLIDSRLGLRQALRAMSRDRSAVRVYLVDGEMLTGTLDRVGFDHLDVAVHAPGESRRRHGVREVAVVRLGRIAAVRRTAG